MHSVWCLQLKLSTRNPLVFITTVNLTTTKGSLRYTLSPVLCLAYFICHWTAQYQKTDELSEDKVDDVSCFVLPVSCYLTFNRCHFYWDKLTTYAWRMLRPTKSTFWGCCCRSVYLWQLSTQYKEWRATPKDRSVLRYTCLVPAFRSQQSYYRFFGNTTQLSWNIITKYKVHCVFWNNKPS